MRIASGWWTASPYPPPTGLQSLADLEAGSTLVHIPLAAVVSRARVEQEVPNTHHLSTQVSVMNHRSAHQCSHTQESISTQSLHFPSHFRPCYPCGCCWRGTRACTPASTPTWPPCPPTTPPPTSAAPGRSSTCPTTCSPRCRTRRPRWDQSKYCLFYY